MTTSLVVVMLMYKGDSTGHISGSMLQSVKRLVIVLAVPTTHTSFETLMVG